MTRKPTTGLPWEQDAGAGLENVTQQWLDNEEEERPFDGPLPHYPDRRSGKEEWEWDDDDDMVAWLVARLQAEEDILWEHAGIFDELSYVTRPGRGLVPVRNPDTHAIRTFEEKNDPDLLIEILHSGLASPPIQRYVAQSWGLGRLAARKSLAQRRIDGWPIWRAAEDVPRIKKLWREFFPKETRTAEKSELHDRACNMAVRRWLDDEDTVADVTEKVVEYLRRGRKNRRRL